MVADLDKRPRCPHPKRFAPALYWPRTNSRAPNGRTGSRAGVPGLAAKAINTGSRAGVPGLAAKAINIQEATAGGELFEPVSIG